MTAATLVIHGVSAGQRSAVGRVVQVRPAPVIPEKELAVENPAGVVVEAFAAVRRELEAIASAAEGLVRDVMQATVAMVDDPLLVEESLDRVAAGLGPARAVDEAAEAVCAIFEEAGGRLAERATDVRSIRHRVVAAILGEPAPGIPILRAPSVVVAEDLAPADTAGLEPSNLLALVTERGGLTSHTAIIAGQLGIPCVVQARGATAIAPGALVAVDAATGRVVVDPPHELVRELETRSRALHELARDRRAGSTQDGHRIALLGNVGTPADARKLDGAGAEGVGLFRTEMLYLGRSTAPTVEEQIRSYAEVFDAAPNRKIVVRTLDAGADKPIPFANLGHEENPALGVRGYRLARRDECLLDEQLMAIALTARRCGVQPWVMAPMISVPEEASAFAARARAAGIGTVGVMVEVPAAALTIDQLLADLDFVSLGTNDLAQYTMGADRLQHELSDLLDPWQPAVLTLIAMTASAGRRRGKPVGVCGESAGDPIMALVLAGLGVTSLSMSFGALPLVRHALRQHTMAQCERLAELALSAPSAPSGRARVLGAMNDDVRSVLAV